MKIFISCAGYRDPLLYNTIVDAYKQAKNKDSLVFGIVDQSFPWEKLDIDILPFKDQIKYFRVDPFYARGVCWARSVAQSLSSDEDYFFQIDSHTMFDADWDSILIDNYNSLAEYHEKPVITSYPHNFQAENNNIFALKKEVYNGLLTLVADENNSFIHVDAYDNFYVGALPNIIQKEEPVHGYLASANFFFSSMKVVQEVPYDPFLFFSGEEHSLALRLYTNGYDIFHIPNVPIYHYYGRGYRTTIWSDENTENKKQEKWWEMDLRSKLRLKELVQGRLTGVYGLGTKRTLEQYIKFSGIDYLNKKISPEAKTGENIFSIPWKEKVN